MVTFHAPLAALSILAMVDDVSERMEKSCSPLENESNHIIAQALEIAMNIIDLIPGRNFSSKSHQKPGLSANISVLASMQNSELLGKIRHFYVSEQGNPEASSIPFSTSDMGHLLVQKSCSLVCASFTSTNHLAEVAIRTRLLVLLLSKMPPDYVLNTQRLLSSMHTQLANSTIPFVCFKSSLSLATQLYTSDLIQTGSLSDLVDPLVRHAWGFLSATEPKYHVETVRCLWQLQTALTTSNRDIEAAIATIMLESDVAGTFTVRPADPGRSFCLLWSHTLQDNASYSDRRAPKTPTGEPANIYRLSGMDYYEVMLTRPLFLMLDALIDERTQLFMAMKNWLTSMVGIEK
jgi:hypothetical protein